MNSNEPNKQIKTKNDLVHNLQVLKSMFDLPRIYLRKYFFDVRTKIDLVYAEKILEESNSELKDFLAKTKAFIFRDLFKFEEECVRNVTMDHVSLNTRIKLRLLEEQLVNLKEEDYDKKSLELEKLINETSLNLKRILLLNRNFVYSTESTCSILIELDISEGVFIQNNKNEFTLSENFLIQEELKNYAKLLKLCFNQLKITRIADFIWKIESQDSLTELIISKENCLNWLDFNDLKGLTYLKRLILSNNSLHSLSSYSFEDLNNLEELFLYGNKLTSIVDETIFTSNLNRLVHLDLSSNQICYLSPSSFVNLISLNTLNISNNCLVCLTSGTFSNLNKLKLLDLSLNQIERLQSDLFDSLDQLVKLNLSNNLIETICDESFFKLNNLKELSLNNNRLASLDDTIFTNLINLEVLSLHHNQIQMIKLKTFQNLKQLKYLDLYDNKLSQFDLRTFDDLVNLEDLKISSNKLKKIDFRLFINLKQIKYLSLCSNDLNEVINFDVSKLLFSLKELNMANNNLLTSENLTSCTDDITYRLLI